MACPHFAVTALINTEVLTANLIVLEWPVSTDNKDLKDDDATKPEDEAVQAAAGEPEQDAEATEQEAVEAASDSAPEAEQEADAETLLAAAQAEAEDFKDRFLRSEAELENVRKRSEREIDKARKYALERFAGDLLAVLDSLEMGLDAAQKEGATLEAVREGNELAAKMFSDALSKHGVKQLDPTGEKFNPDQHEAMVMQPSEDAEPNTVLDTFQKGYVLNDRVLRPARVVVAKAP